MPPRHAAGQRVPVADHRSTHRRHRTGTVLLASLSALAGGFVVASASSISAAEPPPGTDAPPATAPPATDPIVFGVP